MVKKCCTCKQSKELIQFSKNRCNIDGLELRCKDCVLKAQRKRRATPEGRLKMQKWANDGYHRRVEKDPLYSLKRSRAKPPKTPKQKSEKSEYDRIYRQERKKVDIEYKLADLLRKRMWAALKGNFKSGSAVKDLGCSVAAFRLHLESQFYNNPITGEAMAWENYGKKGWQIDHIIPLISFKLEDRSQYLVAANYKNQQPLWGEEHTIKSAKERRLFLKS